MSLSRFFHSGQEDIITLYKKPFIKNPPPFRRIPTLVYYDHPYFPEGLQENLGYTMHSLVFVLIKGDYFSVSNFMGMWNN